MIKKIEALLEETRRLYEAMYRFDTAAARKLGIHISDLRCVNALESGPLSPGEIGQRLSLTSGSVSSMLDRLQARGYVRRTSNPKDQRRVAVELEPKFFSEANAVYGVLGKALGSQFTDASSDDVELAVDHLGALRRGFDHAVNRN